MTCSRLYVRDTTPGKDRLEGETLNAGSCRQPGKGQQGLDGKESVNKIPSPNTKKRCFSVSKKLIEATPSVNYFKGEN